MKTDDDARLLALAAERGYYRPRCEHANATLCQHEYSAEDVKRIQEIVGGGWKVDRLGWFAIYQCDECWMPLDLEVSAQDMEDGLNLPKLDVRMAKSAIDAVIGGDIRKTLRFFSKAIMGR